jgi:hypothetical protein
MVSLSASLSVWSYGFAQDQGLTVNQIMQAIITPMTNTLWGAYDVQTDAQWLELQNAALTVIGAGSLLTDSGPNAAEAEWQEFNQQMIAAARAALTAIGNKDEEALSSAGNDLLYPPCESCHLRYMSR